MMYATWLARLRDDSPVRFLEADILSSLRNNSISSSLVRFQLLGDGAAALTWASMTQSVSRAPGIKVLMDSLDLCDR